MLSNKRGNVSHTNSHSVPFLALCVLQVCIVWTLKALVVLTWDATLMCGLLACRAKHQKLKTGNDQSPTDKKPETEADQGMSVML